MKILSLVSVAFVVACGSTGITTTAGIRDADATAGSVQTNGALRLETHDAPIASATMPPFGPPAIAATAGAIEVTRQQYGSLCRHAVTGHADVNGSTIGLHIVFTERLTMCTAELRVLQYKATLATAPGTYDVAVIHDMNGAADTLARQTVTVP
jgi:hypothetical protein